MILAYPLEIKSLDQQAGTFEGIASVYQALDQSNERVLSGAFSKNLALQGRTRPLLAEHRDTVGTVELKDTPSGLLALGQFTLEVQRARDVLALVKSGAMRGLSIGFLTVKDQFVNGVRELVELKLFEISVVTFPCLESAQITSVKSADRNEITAAARELKAWRESLTKQRTPQWIRN